MVWHHTKAHAVVLWTKLCQILGYTCLIQTKKGCLYDEATLLEFQQFGLEVEGETGSRITTHSRRTIVLTNFVIRYVLHGNIQAKAFGRIKFVTHSGINQVVCLNAHVIQFGVYVVVRAG